jgi:RNA polymerase sigma factor (sigma-70 family)
MGMDWVLQGQSLDRSGDMIVRRRESVEVATEPTEAADILAGPVLVERVELDPNAEWLKLTRLAYSVIGDRQVAEELVQESYIRLQKAGDRVENRAAFLRVTVINRCKSYSVRRGKERAELWRNASSTESTTPQEIDETLLALRNLVIKYRTVLALRYYEDLSIDEIAKIINVRPGTVKSLIHRGLAKLRTELERQTP